MKTLQLQPMFKYLEILIEYINKFLFLVVKRVCEYLENFVLRIKQTLNDIQIKVEFPLHTRRALPKTAHFPNYHLVSVCPYFRSL